MPRIVDHDARRLQVSDIACNVIARDGVDAATVRRVAEEAKCSTTIVSHYFTNKHELLLLTYRTASSQTWMQVKAMLEKNPTDLDGILQALLPLDDLRLRNWKIWFAFWGMAIGDAEFGSEHRTYLRRASKLIATILRNRYGDANDKAHEREARRLFALVSGLAAESVFDRSVCPPKLLRALIIAEVAQLDRAHDILRSRLDPGPSTS